MNEPKVIFSMVRVVRRFPPSNKEVIRDISLGFKALILSSLLDGAGGTEVPT